MVEGEIQGRLEELIGVKVLVTGKKKFGIIPIRTDYIGYFCGFNNDFLILEEAFYGNLLKLPFMNNLELGRSPHHEGETFKFVLVPTGSIERINYDKDIF